MVRAILTPSTASSLIGLADRSVVTSRLAMFTRLRFHQVVTIVMSDFRKACCVDLEKQ